MSFGDIVWENRGSSLSSAAQLPPITRPQFFVGLAERGEYKPVIDRRYPFDQIVEAHRYVDTGRKTGNVVLTLGH